MGRDAGWPTAAGVLAQDICGTGPDLPPPEILSLMSMGTHFPLLNSGFEKQRFVVSREGVHHADGSFDANYD